MPNYETDVINGLLKLDYLDDKIDNLYLTLPYDEEVDVISFILPLSSSSLTTNISFRPHTAPKGYKPDLIIHVPHDYEFKNLDFKGFNNVLISSARFIEAHGAVFSDSEINNYALKFENIRANNLFIITGNVTLRDCQIASKLWIKTSAEATESGSPSILLSKIEIGSTTRYWDHDSTIDTLYVESTPAHGIAVFKNVKVHQGDVVVKNYNNVEITNLRANGEMKSIPQISTLSLNNVCGDAKYIYASALDYKIYPFLIPSGKFEIAQGVSIEFIVKPNDRFEAKELVLTVGSTSNAVGAKIYLPFAAGAQFVFDRVEINTKSEVIVEAKFVSRTIEIKNSPKISFSDVSCESFNYSGDGEIRFGKAEVSDVIEIKDALKVFSQKIIAKFFVYTGSGKIRFDYATLEHLVTRGQNDITFGHPSKVFTIVMQQGGDLSIQDSFESDYIDLNTDVSYEDYPDSLKGITILNTIHQLSSTSFQPKIIIGTIKARLSEFIIAMPVTINEVFIDPASSYGNLIKLDPMSMGKIKIGKLAASKGLYFNPETGQISVIMDQSRMLGSIFAEVRGTEITKGFLLSAWDSVSLNGKVMVKQGVSLLQSGNSNVIIQGQLYTEKEAIVLAPNGAIYNSGANIDALRIVQQSGEAIVVIDSFLNAKQILIHAFNNVSVSNSEVRASKDSLLVITDNGSFAIAGSQISAAASVVKIQSSSNSGRILTSSVQGVSIIVETFKNLLVAKSALLQVDIEQSSFVIFTEHDAIESNEEDALIGIAFSSRDESQEEAQEKDGDKTICKIMGIVAASSGSNLSQLKYQKVDALTVASKGAKGIHISANKALIHDSSFQAQSALNIEVGDDTIVHASKLAAKTIYIDSGSGKIMGSEVNAADYVVIKVADNLELVPIVLHNAFITMGGYTINAFKNIVTKINTGLLSIEAGGTIKVMGAIFKALRGSFEADYVDFEIAEDFAIQRQQDRIMSLQGWLGNNEICQNLIAGSNDSELVKRVFKTHDPDLDFSEEIRISVREGKVDINKPYKSKIVKLRQAKGDVVISDSIDFCYDEFYLQLDTGELLITSKPLVRIYGTPEAISQHKVTIGGNNVYLKADKVVVEGVSFEVTGSLKIVANHGVFLLPIAVHTSYVKHMGSKFTEREWAIRQVVSEINAGVLEIDAGRALEIVGALIKAANVDLKADEVGLKPAVEIFDRQLEFKGKKKLWGKRNKSTTNTHEEHNLGVKIESEHTSITGKDSVLLAGAQIDAEKDFIVRASDGQVSIENVKNIYLKETHSKKSKLFNCHGGKMKVASTKSVHEAFSGEGIVPTIIHAGGKFYGYADGNFYVLASKLIGDGGIELVSGHKDIKLGAAPGKEGHFLEISESGLVVGFDCKNGSYKAYGGAFDSNTEQTTINTYWEKTELITNNLILTALEGSVIQTGADFYVTGEAYVKAKNWIIEVIRETRQHNLDNEEFFIGIEAGFDCAWQQIMQSVIQSGKQFEHGRIDGAVNGASKAYSAWRQTHNTLALAKGAKNSMDVIKAGFTPGVSVGASASIFSSDSYDERVVPQFLQIGNLRAEIENEIKFEGVIYDGDGADIVARIFTTAVGEESHHSSQSSTSIKMKIPIYGGGAPSASASGSQSKMTATTYAPSYIHLTAKLKVRVEEMKVIGVDVEAEITDIDTKNLLVESVQDRAKSKGSSFSVSVGAGGLNSADGSISNSKSAWTNNFGNIIGRSALTIVAQDTISLAGGMIANAERDASGNYTDKGQADITTGKLIIKHLHDYDDGLTLGLGITPAPKSIGKDVNGKDVAPIYGSTVSAQVGFKAESQVVNSVIGDGNLKVDGKVVDARSQGAKAVHEKVSAKEHTKMRFDGEFVTSVNRAGEQAARDNFKNAKAYKPDWVQKSTADQEDKTQAADKKPAPKAAKAKTDNKTSHHEEHVDEEGEGFDDNNEFEDHAESFMEYAVRNMPEAQRAEFFRHEAQQELIRLESEKYDDQRFDLLLSAEASRSLQDYRDDWTDEEFKQAHKQEYLRLVEQKIVRDRDPGFIGKSLKSGADYIKGQLETIDPNNMEQIERVSRLLNCYYYASNIISGARTGVAVGAVVPIPLGAEFGGVIGAVGGAAKAYFVDQVTEAGITVSAQALKASYPNLTDDDAYLLVSATLMAHGSKDLLKNLAIKVQSGSGNFARSIKETIAGNSNLEYAGVGKSGKKPAEADILFAKKVGDAGGTKPDTKVGQGADTAEGGSVMADTTKPNVGDKKFVWDPSPYHHPQSQGGTGKGKKAPGPTNPKIIEDSVQIKPDAPARIAVDPETKEVVIFKDTNNGTWHGHVVKPKELTALMCNAVRKLGYIVKGDKLKKINK